MAFEVVHEATPAGARMAEEFRRYVPDFSVGGVAVANIYLGDTEFARSHGVETAAMTPDSYCIRSFGSDLVIAGGGSRGMVYGVYGFLENQLGVYVWSPLEETVPVRTGRVELPPLKETGSFFFELRDMYKTGLPADGGRAAMARGFSRNGDAGIAAEFGGGWEYGPPYSCHTFDRYLPASEYLADHPEWFSLVDGKRVGGQLGGQLCLTNPEMRAFFGQRLLDTIARAEADAVRRGVPSPRIYDISHNDNTNFCRCPVCTAFTAREGQSGLMIDFVNELARRVRAVYPELLLQTFAYQYTLEPPANVRPEANVVIRLCNTNSDQITGVSGNPEFQRQLQAWAAIAPKLFLWDYAIVFGEATGLPFPSEYYYPADYRSYADRGVKGIFWEQECADRSDMAELKYYLHGKYMQNPYRDDFDRLLAAFYRNYYGPSGTWVRQYREALRDRVRQVRPWIGWFPSAGDFRYIDWATMRKAQQALAQAREAASDDNIRLRVDRAGMGLDRLLGFELTAEYVAAAGRDNPEEDIQSMVAAARARFFSAWRRSEERGWIIPDKDKLWRRLEQLQSLPETAAPPEKFKAVSHADRPSSRLGCLLDSTMLMPDPEAETGAAAVAVVDSADPGVYAGPVTLGVYNPVTRTGVAARELPREETAQPGYRWYCLRHVQLPSENCFLWLSPSWGIQLALGDVTPLSREKPLDIWVHMKVTGPLFVSGDTAPDRIYFDRVVLTEAGALP